MGWLAPGPGCFTPGKETRYTLYRRLGGPQGRSGRLRKIPPPLVKPVASHYTDRAIPTQQNILYLQYCDFMRVNLLHFGILVFYFNHFNHFNEGGTIATCFGMVPKHVGIYTTECTLLSG
jgi:hypothetical protein